MTDATTTFERIEALLRERGMTARELSMTVTGKPDLIRDIKRRGHLPNVENMLLIADTLDTTVEYLAGDTNVRAPVASEVTLGERPAERSSAERATGPGIPLVGTGDCADIVVTDTETGEPVEIDRASFDPDFHVRYLTRPPALRGALHVYAVYFHGQSMEPRFEAGDIGLVDPQRPPRPGDYVLVQLNCGESDDVVSVLAKRLVRQTATEVELEQFNPPMVFSLPKKRVQRIHRIMPPTDLLL